MKQIRFLIHLNSTNPEIIKKSKQYLQELQNGFNIAVINGVIKL
jgi:hypothetical protein